MTPRAKGTEILNRGRAALRRSMVVALVATIALISSTSASAGLLGRSTTGLGSTLGSLISDLAPGRYVVVLRDGADASVAAKRHKATPLMTFSATFDGYAAVMTRVSLGRAGADAEVRAVVPDRLVQIPDRPLEEVLKLVEGIGLPELPLLDDLVQLPLTPIVEDVRDIPVQEIPTGISRVGTLDSPTAKIDGVDDPLDVDIAILDTGIDPDHPDLNVAGGYDCVTFGRSSYRDYRGHGTHVAGTAAAKDNGFGVVGVAPGARVWGIKVLTDIGVTTYLSYLCGFEWVTRHAHVIDVANASFGGPALGQGSCADNPLDLFHRSVCAAVNAGVVVTAGAGNDGQEASAGPAVFAESITVSGIADSDGQPGGLGPKTCVGGDDDTFDTFSSFGPHIDIAAPSECILSTAPGGRYGLLTGTSMASPHVAGAAALILATNPNLTPAQVRARLLETAEPGPIPGDPDPYPEGVLNVSNL